VGKFLREYLDVDVDAITKELKESGIKLATDDNVSWMGPLPEEGQRLDGQNHIDTYNGDFRKRGVAHADACGCGKH
jgi:alkaline phosphatase